MQRRLQGLTLPCHGRHGCHLCRSQDHLKPDGSVHVITDDEIHQRMIMPLPEGCILHCVVDACHSGSGKPVTTRDNP